MKVKIFLVVAFVQLLLVNVFGQENTPRPRLSKNVANEYVYSSNWSANFRLRSDGWQVGGEISKYKNYSKSTIYQFDIGMYKHPKQVRQNKDPYAGWFNSNGIKPFIYGKQNTLIAIHVAMGQRFLLAEKARRNGVMINYYYAGGVTLGLLKPYYLRVCSDDLCTYYDVVTYDPSVNNRFTSYDYIIGGAGFGVGWKMKFRPGLHFKSGFQFDWSSQDNMIKAVDIGLSVDGYFSKVPMMVTEKNRFIFINAYVGISLGKKK